MKTLLLIFALSTVSISAHASFPNAVECRAIIDKDDTECNGSRDCANAISGYIDQCSSNNRAMCSALYNRYSEECRGNQNCLAVYYGTSDNCRDTSPASYVVPKQNTFQSARRRGSAT